MITEDELLDRDYLTVGEIHELAEHFEVNKMDLADVCECTYSTFSIYMGDNSTDMPVKHQTTLIHYFLRQYGYQEMSENGVPNSEPSQPSPSAEEAASPVPEPDQPTNGNPGPAGEEFEIVGDITAGDIPPASGFTRSKYEPIVDKVRDLDPGGGIEVRLERPSAPKTIKKLLEKRLPDTPLICTQRQRPEGIKLYIVRKQ